MVFIDSILLVEWFCDELGDWWVILYLLYGLWVYGLFVFVVGWWLCDCYGIDEKLIVFDNGIMVCLLDIVFVGEDSLLGVELFVFDVDEIDLIVIIEVVGLVLFVLWFWELVVCVLLLFCWYFGCCLLLW